MMLPHGLYDDAEDGDLAVEAAHIIKLLSKSVGKDFRNSDAHNTIHIKIGQNAENGHGREGNRDQQGPGRFSHDIDIILKDADKKFRG